MLICTATNKEYTGTLAARPSSKVNSEKAGARCEEKNTFRSPRGVSVCFTSPLCPCEQRGAREGCAGGVPTAGLLPPPQPFDSAHRIPAWQGLAGPSGDPPAQLLPKQGHPEQAAHDLVHTGVEYLQRRRIHSPSGQRSLQHKRQRKGAALHEGKSRAKVTVTSLLPLL